MEEATLNGHGFRYFIHFWTMIDSGHSVLCLTLEFRLGNAVQPCNNWKTMKQKENCARILWLILQFGQSNCKCFQHFCFCFCKTTIHSLLKNINYADWLINKRFIMLIRKSLVKEELSLKVSLVCTLQIFTISLRSDCSHSSCLNSQVLSLVVHCHW